MLRQSADSLYEASESLDKEKSDDVVPGSGKGITVTAVTQGGQTTSVVPMKTQPRRGPSTPELMLARASAEY